MENIETILNKAGVELTDEQKAAVIKGVAENYKTVADYDKQKEKYKKEINRPKSKKYR